jgi:hypothetical protein
MTHVLTISSQHVAVLAAGLIRRQVSPCNSRSYNGLKLRFTATVGEEPEVEVGLI